MSKKLFFIASLFYCAPFALSASDDAQEQKPHRVTRAELENARYGNRSPQDSKLVQRKSPDKGIEQIHDAQCSAKDDREAALIAQNARKIAAAFERLTRRSPNHVS